MFTGPRVAILLGVPLLIASGFLVFLVTNALVRSGETPPSPVLVIESGTAAASASASGPPEMTCGAVQVTDASGNPIGTLGPLVRGIHDAACRRDYSGLLPFMEDPFGGAPKKAVVAGWQRQDSDGALLRTLAETLETRARGDQGGQYFCHPDGAVAVFARGTVDKPRMWSDFDPTGRGEPDRCEVNG